MIESKEELRYYLQEDYLCNVKHTLGHLSYLKYVFFSIMHSDPILSYKFLKRLRHYEYTLNCRKGKGIFGNIEYFVARYKYMRSAQVNNIYIKPNVVGYGLRLPHVIGGGIIINCRYMGIHCTVNTGVIIGQKHNHEEVAVIGDNVDICPGAKIIGAIHIGNDVIIAPNTVVIKDVPDGAVISGVPSRIIKFKY